MDIREEKHVYSQFLVCFGFFTLAIQEKLIESDILRAFWGWMFGQQGLRHCALLEFRTVF